VRAERDLDLPAGRRAALQEVRSSTFGTDAAAEAAQLGIPRDRPRIERFDRPLADLDLLGEVSCSPDGAVSPGLMALPKILQQLCSRTPGKGEERRVIERKATRSISRFQAEVYERFCGLRRNALDRFVIRRSSVRARPGAPNNIRLWDIETGLRALGLTSGREPSGQRATRGKRSLMHNPPPLFSTEAMQMHCNSLSHHPVVQLQNCRRNYNFQISFLLNAQNLGKSVNALRE
jgi:hypothetical protein